MSNTSKQQTHFRNGSESKKTTNLESNVWHLGAYSSSSRDLSIENQTQNLETNEDNKPSLTSTNDRNGFNSPERVKK